MAGTATEESGAGRLVEGAGGQQQSCQAGEALAEWRSSEQVENGTPSTSPPYWDSEDDDDGGPKPSELFGKYTWKIDKFSQINKRELRSSPFDVGGYKWYILIYPQGCDVCNHLSLFLCVANHDKLLPGWSHFAQFTICVVNKDPKKSKYSDTLHRFWKKEHDWGWKKFMELSKLLDGFIDADTLIIKAQVQVIRERADRPFRCLDCLYRRELVRVYLTNVEQICRRFVEERRVKLGKLIDDKAKWSSFCSFWLGMDQSSKRRMSQEKTESILKIVVKHFFIEKEVTSTLVMDSLYSGLRALEGHQKGKKSKSLNLETEESVPIVRIEKDMFLLVDDVLPLLERVAMEPLPPKDDKGPQNRTKDVVAGEELSKDPIEHEERRLTELGRRTLEIFILAHVFSSKIEVAYQEAVALKRQEELIREEEEAWLAEIEQKARRGAADKEKKSKKKQGKQKRNNRKGKDKGRDDKASSIVQGNIELDSQTVDGKDSVTTDPGIVLEKSDVVEDVSDVSDSEDHVPEILPPDSDERDASPVHWDTDTSEVHPVAEASGSGISGLSTVQNGRSSSVVDDSSSTCSSDSVPFVSVNASHKGNSQHAKNQKSPRRSRNHQSKAASYPAHLVNEEPSRPPEAGPDAGCPVDAPRSSKAVASAAQAVDYSSAKRAVNGTRRNAQEKAEENGSSHRNSGAAEASRDRTAHGISPPPTSSGNSPSIAPAKPESKSSAAYDPPMVKKSSSSSPKQADRPVQSSNSAERTATVKPDTTLKLATPKPTTKPSGHVGSEKPPVQQVTSTTDKSSLVPPMPAMSRPLSAPLIPGPKHPVSMAMTTVQTGPMLSRSASAVGRLGPEPTASATQSYIPQSYRNAILGSPAAGSLPAAAQNHSVSSAVNVPVPYTQAPALVSAPHRPDRMDPNPIRQSFSFGMMSRPDMMTNRPWMEFPERDSSRNLSGDRALLLNDLPSFDMYNAVHGRSQDPFGFPASTSSRQNHVFPEEFPHLDIINDLLEDEHAVGSSAIPNSGHLVFSNGHHYLNQQPPFSFLGEPSISNGPGLSASSHSFERARSPLDDRLQLGYAASGAPYDMIPQASPRSYMNGPTEGLIPSQWQMSGADLPFANVRNTDGNAYSYHIPEYQNLNTGANSYTVFRPSNGH